MMLTIHGLPMSTKYQDLKILVKQQCNITDFILDNLASEGDGTKKVRIGVSDDREGAQLMKSLNGYRYSGNVLQVVPVGKVAPSNVLQQNFSQQRGYNEFQNQNTDYNQPMNQGRSEPWGQGGQSSQWGSNQAPVNQSNIPLSNFNNYQQPSPMVNQSYQQTPNQRLGVPFDRQGYSADRSSFPPVRSTGGPSDPQQYSQGFPAKLNEPMVRSSGRGGRTHVLRSVEVMEEPLRAQPAAHSYHQAAGMPKESGAGMRAGYGDNASHTPHGQTAATWTPHASKPYDRNYPDADNRPGILNTPVAPYNRAGQGFMEPSKGTPRFSPTRDVTKALHTSRFSPRRDLPPDVEGHIPRFSPRDAKDVRIERGLPKDGHVPRFSPRRDEHRFSPRRDVKDGPRFSPRRDIPKDGPRFSPRRDMPKEGPRFSPRRDMPKVGPRFSPRRDVSKDGPRFSPRRDGPKDGPRFSPRRDVSKDGPRFSPRRDGPKDRPRFSPRRDGGGKPERSPPPLRDSHKHSRYSPTRRDDKPEKYVPEKYVPEAVSGRGLKDVRPAYDPTPKAPSQAMYSGGYRPSPHNNVPYPAPGIRQPERSSPWQHDKEFPVQKEERGRDAARGPKFEPRDVVEPKRSRSPIRKSRSPTRRDRSPIRDRFKKHSPSPRSPRRSWALEKRRSPDLRDAPPPPMWPGDNRDDDYKRPIPARDDDKPNRVPIWEPPAYEEPPNRDRRVEEDRRMPGQLRVRMDLHRPTQPSPTRRESPHRFKPDDRAPKFEQRESRFEPRDPKFEPRDGKFEQRTPKFDPREPEFERRQPQFEPRDPKFEPRDPKFEPRDPKLEPRGHKHHEPKFEPREPKFETREPKLETREPKFEPREPRFEPREPRFEPREPKFVPREDFPERRADLRRDDRPPSRDFRDAPARSDRPDLDIERRDRKDEYARRDDKKEFPVVHEKFEKELDDVYKRAKEFNKRAQELRKREELVEHRSRLEKERLRDSREETEYHHADSRRQEDSRRHREEFKSKDMDWQLDDDRSYTMSPSVKAKRDKAVDELATRIIDKHGKHYPTDLKRRVHEELKISLIKMLKEMYGNQDISFIEIVVKFNAKFNSHDELRMLEDVIESLPSQYRSMKRAAEDAKSEVPAKAPRPSDSVAMSMDATQNFTHAQIAEWNMNMQAMMMGLQPMVPQEMVAQSQIPPPQLVIPNPIMDPLMAQNQAFMPGFGEPPKMVEEPSVFQRATYQASPVDTSSYQKDDEEDHHLYLCKDDFEPFSDNQAEHLKRFLVGQLVNASTSSQGWTPDFTVKGLQSQFRYELLTRDENTKNWIVNLDFSEFPLFNVLVYTKEELWYERAAIWLPGHSRCRNIEPLGKLKLQNRKLHGVNIGKWKLVKKIVNAKGTRVYVDMPPSSARALEKHKMTLSYELQKVNVFLKAIAIDKDAFDAGLKEMSVKDQTEIIAAVQNSPMPSLNNDPHIVKIALKGNKALSVVQARKIKEMVIYHIFKYHQEKRGHSRTDFVKFGYILPGYFGILPENNESSNWLKSLDIGKLKNHAIVVLGVNDDKCKLIRMSLYINSYLSNELVVLERIKQSNQGVKGLNFNRWRPGKIKNERRYSRFEVDMDLESVETIIKLNYQLDYADHRQRPETIDVKYDGGKSKTKLEDLIKKYKAEQVDCYDVANMDLASSDEDDDIIYMGEVDN